MQKDIAAMFGGKARDVPNTKNAVVRGTIKAKISDLDSLIPDADSNLLKPLPIPNDVKELVNWSPGDNVPFLFVANALEKAEKETQRNLIIKMFSQYFLAVLCTTPQDLIPFVFLGLGILRPRHEGVKLNIGDEILIHAISEATGTSGAKVKQQLKEDGDLAIVAQNSRSSQKTMTSMFGKTNKSFTIRSVYSAFLEISSLDGANSQKNRAGKIQVLLTSCQSAEIKFLVRMLQGKLRIGASQSTILVALGYAFRRRENLLGMMKNEPDDDDLKKHGKIFKKLYNRYPVLDKLIAEMLRNSFKGALESCDLTMGIPVIPMLAKPAKTTAEIIRRLGDVPITAEYKYDGERAQIHKRSNGKVSIFSRSAEDSTAKFADIAEIVINNFEGEDFILDSEIVAFNTEKNIILPFQVLMNRPKKGSDEIPVIQVCIFLFDILFYNGKSLISVPLSERRKILHAHVNTIPNKLQTATFVDKPLDQLQDFFNESIERRTEGLMIKTLDGEYEPGKRSQLWAKLKKDYIKDIGGEATESAPDTIDVVVLGAVPGQGKRTHLYGSFLIGLYNDNINKFQSLTFLGTGFSEQLLKDLYEQLHPYERETPPKEVEIGDIDEGCVFFEPKLVWEVLVADFLLSPNYRAAFGDLGEDKGISLRFARYYRNRDDKTPLQSTSTNQLIDLYHSQINKNE